MLPKEQVGKVAGDTFSGMAVPEFWNTPMFSPPGKDFGGFAANCPDITANHRVGALFDCDGTLGIFTHRQAGNTERCCFLLKATGVGENNACAGQEADHFEVALRWQENKPVTLDMMAKAKAFDVCPGSRVQGEDQRQLSCNFVQDFQQKLLELFRASPAADLERNMKALMGQTFNRLELVTRDEFEIQVELMRALRARVDALEARSDPERRHDADLASGPDARPSDS